MEARGAMFRFIVAIVTIGPSRFSGGTTGLSRFGDHGSSILANPPVSGANTQTRFA
jgi:hypothetical protein